MSQNLFPLQNEELQEMVESRREGRDPDIRPIGESSGQVSGLAWARLFGEGDPYDAITWVRRDARITKGSGKVVF